MFHKTYGVGRLGHTPKLNSTNSGKAVCNLDVAVDDGKDATKWYKVVVWDADAVNAEKYLGKGSIIYFEGRGAVELYEGRDGTTKFREVIKSAHIRYVSTNKPQGDEQPASDIPF